MAADTEAPEADVVGYGPEGYGPSAGFKASVIDLGFNSAKLATYHVDGESSYRLVSQEDSKVKLGEGLDETGFLEVSPMERTLRVLKMFREIVDMESPRHVLPVATSALREAANRAEFIHLAEQTSKFRFRVVTEREEALLSYLGAAAALRVPTGVYFDLGGGTLAVVYAEDFRVKRVLSLPLGARRLTYLYGNQKKGAPFSRRGYASLKEHVMSLLPTKKELRLAKGARLVGIGGTVRALASFHAEKSGYPFEKPHNYVMDYDEVSWTATQFYRMKRRQFGSLPTMGQARAETMAAGSCVVRLLMKSLGVPELVSSTHGLREGTVALFLHDRSWVGGRELEPVTVDRQLASIWRVPRTPWDRHVELLYHAGLVDGHEQSLLSGAHWIVRGTPQSANLAARFHELMGVDSPLSHADQLRVAVSVISAASGSYASTLVGEFSPPLRRKDRGGIKRLSAAYRLLELLEVMNAALAVSGSANSGGHVKMGVTVGGVYAEELLARAVSTMRDEFKTVIEYSVSKENGVPPVELKS